jgi:hypothetical protein
MKNSGPPKKGTEQSLKTSVGSTGKGRTCRRCGICSSEKLVKVGLNFVLRTTSQNGLRYSIFHLVRHSVSYSTNDEPDG